MRYHPIGDTGLKVSEISFGAGTGAGLMVHGHIEEQTDTVRAALDAGINHFDTAAFYGFGASEIYLGQALRRAGARDVLVTTKVAIGREWLASRDLGRCVRQSVEQSLARLRREAIDVLLVHNATHRTHAPYDPARESERVAYIMNNYLPALTLEDLTGDGGVLEEVERLITAGKVRCFGLSGQDNDPAIVKGLIRERRIALFNQTYNLLNPSAGFPAARGGRRVGTEFAAHQRELFIEFEDVIEAAREANVGVSVISVLAAGVLTDAADRGEPPAPVARRANRFPFPGEFERQLELVRRFKPVARAAGLTLAELAIRFVLSTPGVTTLVGGLSSRAQVEEMVRYCDQPPLGEEVLAGLREVWLGSAASSASKSTSATGIE
jgi:aryl-alcohol dehydrogenase-like predicted oxidoreductase